MNSQNDVGSNDALALLRAEHGTIRALLLEFHSIKNFDGLDERLSDLADEIGERISMLSTLEAEMLYPAVRGQLDDDELIDEAEAQHASACDLVTRLHALYPGDDFFKATVTVLGEEFEQHATLEEDELFPRLRQADIDFGALGTRLLARRQELDDASLPPLRHPDLQPGRRDPARRRPRTPE